MAAPTYSTDLALIDDAQDVTSYAATGGGASALNDETDYFINGAQCISKNGFTAVQKGIIHDDVAAPTIAAGDAVFIWARQANRNILDTVANQGGAVIMGTSNAVFAGFNVDGNDVEGSDLLSWVCYAVDPTQFRSYVSGSPGAASTWDHFGFEWTIGSSGSLKGAPNAVGAIRHGRELRAIDGDLGNGYATFTGMAAHDSDTTRRYGILTEATGTLLFHGALILGQGGTAVDFRDADVSITVRDNPFVPLAFNEIEILNASSNVEWTNIQIAHLGIKSPTTLTLNVGTFTGVGCSFDRCGDTLLASTGEMSDSSWVNCGSVTAPAADLSGSSIENHITAITDAQDETSYDGSPASEGSFSGGVSGYAVSDVIYLEDGTEITVDAVSAGVVTQFTVSSTNSAPTAAGTTINENRNDGAGDGTFSLTTGVDNYPESASLVYNSATDTDGLLDGMTFTQGPNDVHAIDFGTSVTGDIVLRDIDFNGFDSTTDSKGATLRFLATSGSLTVTLVNCTVDGAAATTSNVGVDDAAGIVVTLSTDIVGTFTNLKDNTEVRVYDSSSGVELAGIENATAGSPDARTFAATIGGGTVVDYVIHNEQYEHIRINDFTWPSTAQNIVINQRLDLNFEDPP